MAWNRVNQIVPRTYHISRLRESVSEGVKMQHEQILANLSPLAKQVEEKSELML